MARRLVETTWSFACPDGRATCELISVDVATILPAGHVKNADQAGRSPISNPASGEVPSKITPPHFRTVQRSVPSRNS